MRWAIAALRRRPILIPIGLIVLLAGFQVRPRAYWGTGWRPAPFREGLPTAKNGVVDRFLSVRPAKPRWRRYSGRVANDRE